MKNYCIAILFLVQVAISSGCASTRTTSLADHATETTQGYLRPEELPDSLALLPAPPAKESASFAFDAEVSRTSLALRGTPRWALAARDAVLKFPEAAETFSCALNIPITEQETPHLYTLLLKTRRDASHSTRKAKDYYRRARPFMVNKEPICTPDDEQIIALTGSYPSGHTTIGWAWALILAEIAPERVDAILARGRAFGESRVVCNVHWQSDVAEGRVMGAGTVARLHADPAFRADLEAARAEFAAVRGKGLKPQRDCAEEAVELTTKPY